MLMECLTMLLGMFSSLFDILDDLFTSLGVWGLIFSLLSMYTAYRFLLKPILGGSGSSDSVRRKKGE